MKKLGILLSANPHDGGSYQYSQSIVQAALSLPHDSYELIFAYGSSHWESLITKKLFRIVRLQSESLMWKCLSDRKFLLLSRCPANVWRKLCKFIVPDIRKILNENCDLWIFPAQDTWSYILPVPSLSVIHDLMHRYERRFPEVSNGLIYKQREKHYKNVCHYSDAILVDSEVGKTHVMESYGLAERFIHVLPYVAPSYIEHGEKDSSALIEKLPSKFLFYPAQFWKHKNHEILIRTIGHLRKDIPDLKMVFAGSPKNAYAEITDLISKLSVADMVTFLGYIPDEHMATIYKRARALIMPTYFGPSNIPPLEAFASGCPVAISKIYGIPEQVGNAALLFDPSSETEITDIIYRLWSDDNLCLNLSNLGRERYQKWNHHHFSVRFHEIVQDVINK